jgi:hypothetical protein
MELGLLNWKIAEWCFFIYTTIYQNGAQFHVSQISGKEKTLIDQQVQWFLLDEAWRLVIWWPLEYVWLFVKIK